MDTHFSERSQVRDSTINALTEKVKKRSYGKYLSKVTLQKLRGFENAIINFEFPVTAIVGPNGGGKTTILGAAACAYKDIAPRRFFAKSGPLDNSMADWSIEYEIVDRVVNSNDVIRRTASFRQLKWSRDALSRNVIVFGVARTVPATERADMTRYANSQFKFEESSRSSFSIEAANAISRILGKDVSGYSEIIIDEKGSITLLAGKTNKGIDYSEFHFGAGESSIIRMVLSIENSSENSLILIEEIENGLHPVATRKMVEYLIEVVERKKLQAIFTTHSNDALSILPDQAIWAAVNNATFQGKLNVESLRAITGQIKKQAAVFCEDNFAKTWIESCLRYSKVANLISKVEVHDLQGDGNAVRINKHHNIDPARMVPSICFIDGDSSQSENPADFVFRLPGAAPESYIFDTILERFSEFGGKLALTLMQPFNATTELEALLLKIRRETSDHHLLYSILGEQLGFLPEQTIKLGFLTIWAQAYPEAAESISAEVAKLCTD